MMVNFTRNEKVFFPCYTPEELEQEDERFDEAYELHMNPNSNEDIVSAVHQYHEAFIEGCPEAGANILNIICKTIANGIAKNPNEPKVFQDKLEFYIDVLTEEYEYSIGRYYAAVAMIYNLFETDDDEECSAIGWELMEELAKEKNKWAIAYKHYANKNR